MSLALVAGMVAAVNPCGFALLPAYLAVLTADQSTGRGGAVVRALVAAGAVTVGFVAVFGVFGLLLAPVASTVTGQLPWVTIGAGVLLVVLGVALVARWQVPGLRSLAVRAPAAGRSPAAMVGFGVAYALASLSCTAGPFLALVVSSLRADTVASGLGRFLAYAAGMGLVIAVAAVAVALARERLLRRLRRAGTVVTRLAGALLVVAGGYVAWYGWYELRVLGGGPVSDPVVDTALQVQGWLTGVFDRLGPGWFVAALGVLLAAAAGARLHRRRRVSREAREPVAATGRVEETAAVEER